MTQSSLTPTYYNIADGVTAFSTTRHGGVGQGAYASFNINEWCGDDPQHIAENRQLLADELGLPSQHIIMPHQTHGIDTRFIAKEFVTLPDNIRRMLLEGVDAVMTDLSGVCIGVSTADCIPVLLYDEAHHAVCAIHAGWRGTAARIVLKAITDMRAAYHTDPTQLKAIIGPGISERNFEVGDEVYDAFAEAMFDMDAVAHREMKRNDDAADPKDRFSMKWHINLPLCNQMLLEQAGVPKENILDTAICTFDNTDDYFSARRLGINSGRIYNGIFLNPID